MTAPEIIKQLRPLGAASYKKVLLNHGIREPVIGVKISELKKFQKQIKKDYALSLALYDTGIYDAQYLAGLIADESKMTRKDLEHWLKKANCATLCGFTVAALAAESSHGRALGLKWIEAKDETTALTGWTTLSYLAGLTDDSKLDRKEVARLLQRVEKTIHESPNHVRYAMNGFVIAVGAYVKDLSAAAIETGKRIGKVTVDMGNTACQVPFAPDYIKKCIARGSLTKKRKSARC